MTTLGAHEILLLIPKARARRQEVVDSLGKLRPPRTFDEIEAAADADVVRSYGPAAQRLHDEAVRRTLEGG